MERPNDTRTTSMVSRQSGSSEDYWLSKFSGELTRSNFPYDYKKDGNYILEEEIFEFTGELFSLLMKVSNNSDLRFHMTLVAGLIILLHKYTGNSDIVLGVPIYKQQTQGELMNTALAIRHLVEAEETFKQVLIQVRQSLKGAVENQDYPIELLIHQLKKQHSCASDVFSLFDVAVLLENVHERKHLQGDIDMIFSFSRVDGTTRGFVEYNSRLYKKETVKRIILHLRNILEEVLPAPDSKISDLEMLSEEERRRLLIDFNDTKVDYPKDKTIHCLFEEQVERTPGHVALTGTKLQNTKYKIQTNYKSQITNNKHSSALRADFNAFGVMQLTYKELNEQSSRLAHLLKEKGVLADSIIGIMMERSIEMIIGIFGILKAGGAYLPVNPDYPQERIDYMLKDSGAKLLVTTDNLEAPDFPFLPATGHLPPATSLAYVIYTSGSTGKPKGVMVEHRPVVNRLNWMQRFYPIGETDVILQKTPITFDVSVWELFWWAMQGAGLCLLAPGDEKNPEAIIEAIETNRVTTMHFVPSMLHVFLQYIEGDAEVKRSKLGSLRQVFTSGEALGIHHVEGFNRLVNRTTGARLINLYGPTEATVDVSYYNCLPDEHHESIPLGKPIDNIGLYIVNKEMQFQPIGIAGELCISGVGLSRGYLNRPGLTAEKFINSPFSPNHSFTHSFIYRTGDLARWLEEGNIEFLGRIDQQIKIRGFRIELGEIESHLLKHENIKEAVVIARAGNDDEKYLCAYFVSTGAGAFDNTPSVVLKDHLARFMPDYMVPAYFVELEQIPLLSNGKVDRKELPEPDSDAMGVKAAYVPPRSEKERMIADIWADVLGVDRVGMNDNFFGLGGHSLKVVSIIIRLNRALGVQLPVSMLFDRPTVAQLAEELEVKQRQPVLKIEKCPETKYYELSHAQKRLWFFNQLEPGNPAYHIPLFIRFRGELDIPALKQAMEMLVRRHESLRTSIHLIEEEESGESDKLEGLPVQYVHRQVDFDFFREEDLSHLSAEEKKVRLRRLLEEEGVRAFDIAKAPLFRISLIKLGTGTDTDAHEHVVVFVMHHIICDAWSIRVMINEFAFFYGKIRANAREDLPPLKFHYKDFAFWQNKLIAGDVLSPARAYWLDKLGGELPLLELPTDYPRSLANDFMGDKVTFTIDARLTQKLKALSRKESCTLFMILTAAFIVFLYRYTHQEDIIVGTLTAGRSIDELEKIIGYFVNILALRDFINGKMTFKKFLKDVRQTMLEAYDNQDYPFDKLVDELKVKRDTARTPVFDIMLVYQTYEDVQLKNPLESLQMDLIEKEYVVNKYDMYLDIIEATDHVKVDFEYRSDLYKGETVSRMKGHYLNILESAAESVERHVSWMDMLSREERKQLLVDFNDTAKDIPRDRCFHDLFEEQVSRTPERIAASHNSKTITYRELNEYANRAAHYLAAHGLGPGYNRVVALYLKRSIHMLAAIIGIFKVGAAYVPIEVEYPAERIRYMLQDAEASLVVADRESRETLDEVIGDANTMESGQEKEKTGILVVDNDMQEQYPLYDPRHRSTPDHYAYMIYTSGTTGRPKGVVVHQQGMINHLYAKINHLSIDEMDRVAQTASPCFDISVWQFLAALLKGGTTIIFDYETVLNSEALLRGLQEEKITIFESVPSLMSVFLEMLENNENAELHHLRWMIPTGEALKPSLVKEWFKHYPEVKLVNAYGPTEVSDDITHNVIRSMSDVGQYSVPIGKPIQNMRIYILDRDLSLCPVGVRGEICAAGLGVGKGYWKNPEKTARVFVPNPYGAGMVNRDYALLYKTGDIGYFREDGNIECLGRIDNQVKIRGFRIELEEIENVMLKHPAVNAGVVVVKEKQGQADSILGFLVEKEEIDIDQFKKFLLAYLPPYMIPSAFVKLEELPLGISGKVDRQALAAMSIDAVVLESKSEFSAPRTEIEKQIAEIWCKSLEIDTIGIHDNFFERGGHSLLIPGIHRKLNKLFPGKCDIGDLFEYLSIYELSRFIEGTRIDDEEDEVIEISID